MKLGIRLYRAHDLDLISLMEEYEFNFTKALYCAITAFVNGETFVVKDLELRYTPKSYKKKSILRVLTLNEEKDKKAILFLEGIEKGYRNSFLKNLLRLYLCRPIASAYFRNDEDAMEAEAMCEIFKEHRKVARAANFSKTTRRPSEGKRPDKVKRAEGDTHSAKSYSKPEGRKPYNTEKPKGDTRSTESSSRLGGKEPYKAHPKGYPNVENVENQRKAYPPKENVYSELSSSLSSNSSEFHREQVDKSGNSKSTTTSSLSGRPSHSNREQANGSEINSDTNSDETELLNAFMGML